MDAPTERPARRPLGSYRESLEGPLGAAPTARPQTNTEGPKRAQPIGQAQIPDPGGKLWDTGIYRAPKGLRVHDPKTQRNKAHGPSTGDGRGLRRGGGNWQCRGSSDPPGANCLRDSHSGPPSRSVPCGSQGAPGPSRRGGWGVHQTAEKGEERVSEYPPPRPRTHDPHHGPTDGAA